MRLTTVIEEDKVDNVLCDGSDKGVKVSGSK